MYHNHQCLLNGFVEDGNPTPASTLWECSVMCLETEGCSSYFYSKNRKLCKLAATRYFSFEELTSVPEYKYYMMRPDCGLEWVLKAGQCYKYMGEKKDFYNAKSSCENTGGFLAITDSLEDDVIIKSFVVEKGNSAWIGGTDEVAESHWVWTNGVSVSFFLWADSEPRGGATENCLEQWTTGWNDGTCSIPLSYLCEK